MIKKFLVFTFLSALLLLFSGEISAQAKQRVRFAKGASNFTVSGTISGYAYRDYIVGARAGQMLSAKLNSKNTFTVLTVFKPDGENLEGATKMDEFTAELPENGDYVVRVLMMRAEARRKNSMSKYRVRISIQ